MKKIIYCFLAILLPLQVGSTAQAKIATEDQQPETVIIPFSPPLEVDLVFDVTRHRPSSNGPKISTMRQIIRFEKANDQYVMTVTPVVVTSGGESINLSQKIEDMKVSDVFKQPMSYDLAADGTIIRMRNWDVVLKGLNASFGETEAEQRVAVFFSRMSPEQAAATFLKDWEPVLGYGDAELEIDAEYEFETDILFGNVSVPAIGTFQLTRNSKNNAWHLTEKTSLKNKNSDGKMFEDFKKLMEGLFDDDETKRLQFEQTMQQLERMKIENSTDIQFEIETGMPIEATASRIMTMETGEVIEITTKIRRIVE